MILYLMRHGIADDRDDTDAEPDDRQRMLTRKGIKRIRKAARGLSALSLTFDRILTSPLERARQTAVIVADALRLEDRLEELRQLSPGQSIEDLMSGLAAYAGEKRILLVGHEPLLGDTVSFLMSGKAGASIQLKKGGICCLEVDGIPAKDPALLHWALTPKQLRQLAR